MIVVKPVVVVGGSEVVGGAFVGEVVGVDVGVVVSVLVSLVDEQDVLKSVAVGSEEVMRVVTSTGTDVVVAVP